MTAEELDKARQEYASLDVDGKRAYYKKLCGKDNPKLSETLLDMFVEYKLQAICHGDLTQQEETRLAHIGANPEGVHHAASQVLFRRRYKGQIIEVEEMPDGRYRYENRIYKSLTAIATLVTGNHINGRRFFAQGKVC